jgi:hypothetical protein
MNRSTAKNLYIRGVGSKVVQLPWLSVVATFQATFSALLIVATVLVAAAYRFGWRSGVLGSALGLIAFTGLGIALELSDFMAVLHVLDWISVVVLFGFGLSLAYQFIDDLERRDSGVSVSATQNSNWSRPPNYAGASIAVWAIIAQAFEIAVVSSSDVSRDGIGPTSLGLALGVVMIVSLIAALSATGLFRRVPSYGLDGVAASIVFAYGALYLATAATRSI